MSHCGAKTLQAASKRIPLKAANANQDLVITTSISPMCLVVKSNRVKEKERDLIRGQYWYVCVVCIVRSKLHNVFIVLLSNECKGMIKLSLSDER